MPLPKGGDGDDIFYREIEFAESHQPERRTLVRRRADRYQAGVLRGEVSPFMGEVVELKPADPDCRYCGGLGYYTGGDEYHDCWCRKTPAIKIESPQVHDNTFCPLCAAGKYDQCPDARKIMEIAD